MTGAELATKVPLMLALYGPELARHREALGLTQEQLGHIVGLAVRTIQYIEAAKRPVMGKSVLIAIAIQWLYERRACPDAPTICATVT